MTDKEVGELWRIHTQLNGLPVVISLNRKLVEERNNQNDDWGFTFEQFGIDPKEFDS
jgi:hypothetical protein